MTEEMTPNVPTGPTHTMNNKKSARDKALRGLFALALAWAFLLLGIVVLGESIGTLNPAQEGSSLHTVVEILAPSLVAVIAAGALLALFIKLKPGFLRVPMQVTSLRLWGTLLAATFIVGATLLMALAAVTMMLDPPGPHPENVQYISLVFWLPPFATAVITPAASILIAWMWMIHSQPATDCRRRRL